MTVLRPIAAPAAPALVWVATKTAAYTAAAGQGVPCDTTTATFAVAAPASPTATQTFRVKWVAGTTAPTVTGVDSTFTGFGQVGDSAAFVYNALLGTPAFQLV